MKKRIFGLLAGFIACLTLGCLTACGDQGGSSDTPPASTPGGSAPIENEMACRVTVKSEGGMRLNEVSVCAYDENNNLVAEVPTNANGVANLFLEEGNYTVRLKDIPLGFYEMGFGYKLSPEHVEENIVLGIELVDEEDRNPVVNGVAERHIYQVGDVMHDFSIQTFSGETLTLSDLLEENKMVWLNFWYATCNPCLAEMPWMNTSYNDDRFAGDFEIIAIHGAQHDLTTAMAYVGSTEWNFQFSHVSMTDLQSYFPITGFPTTVIIDRYGVVTVCETGRLENQNECTSLVSSHLADNYTQDFSNSGENGGEIDKRELPDVTVADPTNEELNEALGTNNLTYTLDENVKVWPFIVTEKDGRDCIYAPNGPVAGLEAHGTSSVLSVTVNVPEGNFEDYVFTFDYMISSEYQSDFFYVLVDGVIIQSYSGPDFVLNDKGELYIPSEWKTSYAYVPVRSGEHTLSFVYTKDSSVSDGEDTVYIDNLRFEAIPDDGYAYVFREAATNRNNDADGYKQPGDEKDSPRFNNYVTVVFNETDGYYHVGNENGPLLLANLMDTGTNWSIYPIWNYLALGGFLQYNEGGQVRDLKPIIEEAASAENNSDNGYVPVDEDLALTLQFITETFGSGYENEWLEMCCYYDAYNTAHLTDPCAGVNFRHAIEIAPIANVGDEVRTVVDIQKLLNPRGYKYAFTPKVSGVYSFSSDRTISKNPDEVDPIAWFTSADLRYNADGSVIFNYIAEFGIDFSFTQRLEAGKTYYIAVADHDPNNLDIQYELVVKLISTSSEITYERTNCAVPPYVNILDANGQTTTKLRAEGIEFAFDQDGYARVRNADGTFGAYIYVNFVGETPFQPLPLQEVINGNSADFGNTAFNFDMPLIDTNLDDVADANATDSKGQPAGDYTEFMKNALNESLKGDPQDELYGHAKVTEEMFEALRLYTIKVHMEDIQDAWQCLCVYYKEV